MGYAHTAEKLASPVPDYLDAFHLLHDPFEDSPADELVFYPGGQREAILDQVAHLSQFSASVVVVAGEPGSGRSTLKDMLQIQFRDRYLIAAVDAAEVSSPQQVFAEIAAVLGYEVAVDATAGELMSAIRSGLQQLHPQAGHDHNGDYSDTLLLLLDDAHLLSDAVLSALLSLLQAAEPDEEPPLQVVLFGDLDLIGRLDSFGMVDILLHDVLLPPFTDEEMAEYLAFRLEAAGWEGELPFTGSELARLQQQAHGLPGAVHQPARELLIDKAVQEQDMGVAVAPSAGLPVAHIFSLVVLVGVLLMAFFYRDSWLGSDDEPVETPASADVTPATATSARAGSSAPAGRPGTSIRLPMGQDDAVLAPADPGAVQESPTSVQDSSASVEDSPASTPAALESATTRPPTVAADDQRSVAPAAAVVPVVADTRTTTPSVTAPATESATTAPAATAPAAASSGSADERHLLSLPDNHYVLQIMASGSKSAVDDYLKAQKNRSSLYLYTTQRNAKPWFVVVTGNYSSVEMARAGIESLPVEQKKAGPWPRKISDVQSQIREFRDI